MMLRTLSRDEALEALCVDVGSDPASTEGMADLLRAEVSAWRSCRRASLLDRVAGRLLGILALDRNDLGSCCDDLVHQGDMVQATGGRIGATPLRVVRVDATRARVFSSLLTKRLRPLLPGDWHVDGLRREVQVEDWLELQAGVESLEGVLLTPEDWAQLDRAPVADATWLASLERRLVGPQARAVTAEAASLPWKAATVTSAGATWREPAPNEASRLWRAWVPAGYPQTAWTAGVSPAHDRWLPLTRDEAARTVFALAREENGGIVATSLGFENGTVLEIPAWLPRPEYRYLDLTCTALGREGETSRWAVPPEVADDVKRVLDRTLGIRLRDDRPTSQEAPA